MINKLGILARLEFGSRITRTDQTQLKSYRFLRIFLTSPEVATPNRKRAYFRTSPSGYLAKNGVDPHIPARKLWLWAVGELGVKQVYLGESWADHNTVAIGEAAYPEIRWGTVTTPSNLDWTIARVR
jgi:hypothetical protein